MLPHSCLSLLLTVRALLLGHLRLRLLTVGMKLLLLRHSRLDPLLAVRAELLLLSHARLRLLTVRAELLLRYSRLHLLLAVRAELLLLSLSRMHRLLTVCAELLLLSISRMHLLLTVCAELLLLSNPALRLVTVRPDLLLLRRYGWLRLMRVRAHFDLRRALRPLNRSGALLLSLDRRRSGPLALHAPDCGRLWLPLGGRILLAGGLPIGLRLVLVLVAVVTRSGSRRSRDRQSGDTCGKKQPSHDLFSFEQLERTVCRAVPIVGGLIPLTSRLAANPGCRSCSKTCADHNHSLSRIDGEAQSVPRRRQQFAVAVGADPATSLQCSAGAINSRYQRFSRD